MRKIVVKCGEPIMKNIYPYNEWELYTRVDRGPNE